jgi:hypothetical protein
MGLGNMVLRKYLYHNPMKCGQFGHSRFRDLCKKQLKQ